ncbi:insulinoma-associated protein 1-like [Denticeps clupeoides]|uniref:C2H2-type domain-containing protein n=1 Tax=Denticeps clupeoides TaxID=299321 RepID=A0AAY4DUV3_9TELE|nr:insulinoma-associated protein 1-like [Denticeps clupeoides]
MPKGFLVKRSRKAGPASYRVRAEPVDAATAPAFPSSVSVAALSLFMDRTRAMTIRFPGCRGLAQHVPSGGMAPAPRAPAAALGPAGRVDQCPRDAASPAAAETFPEPPSPSPSLPEMTTKLGTPSAAPADPNKGKRDAASTSPVLGLRIREGPEEDARRRPGSSSSPLGEFICQLCKERYSDPLSLAHHKCSRIVRVEYRCAECAKAFSCPANLASHRRWHKPRAEEPGPLPAREELGPPPQASDPGPGSGSDEESPFSCPLCAKRFRRQAYLRKHLALHSRKAQAERGEPFPCRFCGEKLFSSPGLTRHINRHHPTESRQVLLLSAPV